MGLCSSKVSTEESLHLENARLENANLRLQLQLKEAEATIAKQQSELRERDEDNGSAAVATATAIVETRDVEPSSSAHSPELRKTVPDVDINDSYARRMETRSAGGRGGSWELMHGGDIGIGPGSYYLDDESISLIKHMAFASEEEVWAIVDEYEAPQNNGVYNPVVMFEFRVNKEVYQLRAHRLKFMYQNLDACTGESAMHFAKAVGGRLQSELSGRDSSDVRIYVRSEAWWGSKKVDKSILS